MAARFARKPSDTETRRLEAADWANAALDELATVGIEGVRIELLAKRLGVTKGSFYWHFRDRDALLAALLDQWRRRATLSIIERIERSGERPQARLSALLRLPFSGPRSERGADVELAIRLWGRRDPRALAALSEVDELRLRYIGNLFLEIGFTPDQARARAALAYAFMRVGTTLLGAEDEAILAESEAALTGA